MSEDLTINGSGEGEFHFSVDPTKIPTSNELPLGRVELKIGTHKFGKTKANPEKGTPSFAILTIQFVMTDNPGQQGWAGMTISQDWFLGSKEDPGAEKQGTQMRNFVPIMNMIKEAGVAVTRTSKASELLKAAEGQVVGADVRLNGGKNEAFKDRHVIKRFWRAGTKQVELVDAKSAGNAGDPELASAFAKVSDSD